MGQSGQTLKKTQLDELLGNSSLGTKSVEEIVAGLVEKKKCILIKERQHSIDYRNPAGTVVRIPKQSKADIKKAIAAKREKDDLGDRLEGEVCSCVKI